MKYGSLGKEVISFLQNIRFFFTKTNINWKCKRFYIYEGYEGYIHTYMYLFQSFFFSRQTFFIFLSYSEKIIINRSYFHILCFPGQRKLKNLPSLWNISKPSHSVEQKHQQTNCLFLLNIFYQLCFVWLDWGLEPKI